MGEPTRRCFNTIRVAVVVGLSTSILGSLVWASAVRVPAFAAGNGVQAGFTFVPHITPLVLTPAPQVTAPGPLAPLVTPLPLAPTGPPPEGTATPIQAVSGGDATIGFDYLEGSDQPRWKIWFQGETIIVSADDPGTVALVNAFQLQLESRARALSDQEIASQSKEDASTITIWSGVVFVASVFVAVPSCAGVPLTFWAAGGTGWICAGSVGTAVGSGALVLTSLNDRRQAREDGEDATTLLEHATEEAEDLFRDLQRRSAP